MNVTVQNIQFSPKFKGCKKSNSNKADVTCPNMLRTQNNNLVDSNYGSLLTKQVSFKGFPSTNVFSDLSINISATLSTMQHGEVLLVGKDLENAKTLLKKSVSKIDSVIKRIFFIGDENLESPVAFLKDPYADNSVLNLGEKDFVIQNSSFGEELAEQGSIVSLEYGDTLHTQGGAIELSYLHSKTNPLKIRERCAQVFDFSDADFSFVHDANSKNIDLIGTNLTSAVGRKASNAERKITFENVGGHSEVINRLNEDVVFPLQFPEAFPRQVSHGHVLSGPPGVGKTLVAKALANETDANFIELKGSDIIQKWVGEPAVKMREFLNEALKKQPCIIFIDEADMILKNRTSHEGQTHINVTNILLPFLSDVEKENQKIFVLLATNLPEVLDPALTRSGRIGGFIDFKTPDLTACKEILSIHTKDVSIAPEFSAEAFSSKLHDNEFVGSDIAEVVSRAYKNMYKRTGVFAKMKARTYTKDDLKSLIIKHEDFDSALTSICDEKIAKKGGAAEKHMGFAAIADEARKMPVERKLAAAST